MCREDRNENHMRGGGGRGGESWWGYGVRRIPVDGCHDRRGASKDIGAGSERPRTGCSKRYWRRCPAPAHEVLEKVLAPLPSARARGARKGIGAAARRPRTGCSKRYWRRCPALAHEVLEKVLAPLPGARARGARKGIGAAARRPRTVCSKRYWRRCPAPAHEVRTRRHRRTCFVRNSCRLSRPSRFWYA